MSTVYDEVMTYYTEAKKSFDNGLHRPAANCMRKVAEVMAEFYVDHYNLTKSYDGLKKKRNFKREINGRKNLLCSIYTLRYNTSKYCDDFKRSLLIFLFQAHKYGNSGSHPGDGPEKWEAEFLIRYFEKEILNQFKIDSKKTGNIDGFIDVTANYNRKKILLYSNAAGKYASARFDINKAPICCCTDNQEAWEVFVVDVDSEGWASFMASDGHYLSVNLSENKEYPPIRAIASESLGWEKFKIFKQDGFYALKAGCNNKWVTCRIDWEDGPLYATCDSVQGWEQFTIKKA